MLAFSQSRIDLSVGILATFKTIPTVRLNFNTIDRIGGIAFCFFAWHYGCGR